MRLSRINLLSRVGLQLLMTFFAVLQQVVVVSFFATHWTDALYASWLVMAAVSNLLIIADLGLHSHTYLSLQKAFSATPRASPAEIGVITAQSAFAYSVVACFILVLGGLASAFLPVPQWLNLSGASDTDLRLAFFFSLAAGAGLVFNFCYSAMLRAVDALNAITFLKIGYILFNLAVTIALLELGKGIVAVTGAALISQWTLNAVLGLYTWFRLPGFLKGRFIQSFETLKNSLFKSSRYIIPLSSELLLFNIPTLVMGVLGRPATEIVLFTLTRIITSFVRQIATFATHPTANEVSHLWMRGDGTGARRAILLSLAIAGSGTGVLTGFFAVFSQEIIHVWTKGIYDGDIIMLGLQLLNIALAFPAIAASTALMFTDQPALITKAKLTQIVALTALSALLGSHWGARGISVAVLVAEFFVTCVPLTLHMKSSFAIPDRSFYAACVFPFLANFLVSLAAALLAHQYFATQSIVQITIAALLWLPLPALTSLWAFLSYTRATQVSNEP